MGNIKDAGKCTACKRMACVHPAHCYEEIIQRNIVINLFVNMKKAGLKPRKGREHFGL